MGEREPLAVGEDARRHELVDPPGDLVDGHVGDCGHVVEPCFLGEDCDRFSNGDRRRAQPREAHQDCAGDRGRGDAAEALGGVCVGGESFCAELVDELSEQERIAAGRFPAALDELRRRRSAVRVREPARDPGPWSAARDAGCLPRRRSGPAPAMLCRCRARPCARRSPAAMGRRRAGGRHTPAIEVMARRPSARRRSPATADDARRARRRASTARASRRAPPRAPAPPARVPSRRPTANRAAPASSDARSSASRPRMRRSNSCRTMPNASSRSSSAPDARNVRSPLAHPR